MSMSAVALGGALALDVLVGEPPRRLHPVALFGSLVGTVDRKWHRPRAVGVLAVLVMPVVAAVVVAAVVFGASTFHPLVGVLVAAVAVFVATSLRRLVSTGKRVVALSTEEVSGARRELRALAGRDASSLSPGEIRSAAVESLAENLADGLVAPLAGYVVAVLTVSATVGPRWGLAVGCGVAAWVKAVNTFDSMLGYRSKPIGWGPARLDDAVMWLPARACALLLALAARRPGVLGEARTCAQSTPSPNSGWPMATIAAILDVRLEKPGVYAIRTDAALPSPADGDAAVRLVALAGVLAYLLAAVVVGVAAWS